MKPTHRQTGICAEMTWLQRFNFFKSGYASIEKNEERTADEGRAKSEAGRVPAHA
jgi:hypothetical protein